MLKSLLHCEGISIYDSNTDLTHKSSWHSNTVTFCLKDMVQEMKRSISIETEWYVAKEAVSSLPELWERLSSRPLKTALPMCPVSSLWVCVLLIRMPCYNAGLRAGATLSQLCDKDATALALYFHLTPLTFNVAHTWWTFWNWFFKLHQFYSKQWIL